jgi:hypothetical protein
MGGPDKSGLSFTMTYVLGSTSACIAETITFPVSGLGSPYADDTISPTRRPIFSLLRNLIAKTVELVFSVLVGSWALPRCK